jgi:hypothetical protein
VKSTQELFRRLERDARTPRETLPIDAFLPSPDSLPTEFPDPPPSSLPVEAREMGSVSDEEERRERRKQRRGRKTRTPGAQPEAPRKLEEEVQEFLNRDRPPGTRPEELSEFVDSIELTDEIQKK